MKHTQDLARFCAVFLTATGLLCARAESAGTLLPSRGETVLAEHKQTQGERGSKEPIAAPNAMRNSVRRAAEAAALEALEAARAQRGPLFSPAPAAGGRLTLEGRPGDVRLVVMSTSVLRERRWIVPNVPLPPFHQWNRWLDEHQDNSVHCAVDWVDENGLWWSTELRGIDQHPERFRVGEGEFQASGVTIYGVYIMPGRTDPEHEKILLDEKIVCDYRIIVAEARKYARKDRRPGEPGTGGLGKQNVGLGGPAWKPSQNSNTYANYLLSKAGVHREAPAGAFGWTTLPSFPYSSDADAGGE